MKDGQYVLMQKDGKIVMQGNGIYVGAAVGTFVSKYLPNTGSKKEINITKNNYGKTSNNRNNKKIL